MTPPEREGGGRQLKGIEQSDSGQLDSQRYNRRIGINFSILQHVPMKVVSWLLDSTRNFIGYEWVGMKKFRTLQQLNSPNCIAYLIPKLSWIVCSIYLSVIFSCLGVNRGRWWVRGLHDKILSVGRNNAMPGTIIFIMPLLTAVLFFRSLW